MSSQQQEDTEMAEAPNAAASAKVSSDAVATTTATTLADTTTTTTTLPPMLPEQFQQQDLPSNRFELELEFIQALASPAYLHFLATSRAEDGSGSSSGTSLLQDPNLQAFFRYLRDTWSQPEYSRFLQYPHALYFLDLLMEKPAVLKEWTLPAFRNFCHQQQFLAWQHRHSVCYGVGSIPDTTSAEKDNNNNNSRMDANGNEANNKDGTASNAGSPGKESKLESGTKA